MSSKISYVVAFFLAIASGCSSASQDVVTPTEVISSVLTTASLETPFADEVFELTVSMRDENFHSYVYSISIGCLDSTPCIVGSMLLFDMAYPVTELSWSPDGQSLAFDSIGDGSSDIFVTLDEGKTIDNITKSQEPNESSPNWSPDGTQIAYAVASSMEDTKIIVSLPDGANTQQILNNVFEPIQFTWDYNGWMAYSASVSTRDGRYQVRILNSDGSLYWVTPLDEGKMNFSTENAVFSPDSKWLVYTGRWLNNDRIYLADLQTKTSRELFSTGKTCNEFKPSWSPDGKWLSFISNCESEDKQQYSLYLASLAQKQKIKLDIEIDGYVQDVIWRPNYK